MQATPETTGAQMILDERKRQLALGWSTDHDDCHTENELASAARAYLSHYVEREWIIDHYAQGYKNEEPPDEWPEDWSRKCWKPKGRLEDLVRAGALVAAEIDRLIRKSKPADPL